MVRSRRGRSYSRPSTPYTGRLNTAFEHGRPRERAVIVVPSDPYLTFWPSNAQNPFSWRTVPTRRWRVEWALVAPSP